MAGVFTRDCTVSGKANRKLQKFDRAICKRCKSDFRYHEKQIIWHRQAVYHDNRNIGRNYRGYLSTDKISVMKIKVTDINKVNVSGYVDKKQTKNYDSLTKNLNWSMDKGDENCEYIQDTEEKGKVIDALL